MYSGEQAAAAPVPQMAMPRDVMSGVVAKGMQQVGANLDGMLMRGISMEDAKNEFEAERELMSINSDTQAEVERMLNTPDGKDGSLFDEHGQIRQEKVMNVRDKVQARLAKVGQNIIDPERRERMMQRALLEGDKILDDLGQTWEKVTRRKTETAWKDTYDLAVAKGEYGEAITMLQRGVDLGLFSKERAGVMKIGLEQERERKRLAALEKAGKAGDGRVVTAEMMQSLKAMPAQEVPGGDVSGLVSSTGGKAAEETMSFSDGKGKEVLTMKDAGFASLSPDELMVGFNVAQRLADSGSVTLNPRAGILEFELPPSPGESTQKVAGVAQAFKGYSLADYRNSIAKVAAGYFSDDRMSGMSDAQLVNALADEVKMDGAADAWFNGDALAYKGWLETELSRLLVTRGSGAVHAADRLMTGAEGRAGLNEMLAQEVTDEEIASLGYGFNAVASITKGGLRDKKALVPAFKQAVQEYERYRERWAKELKAKGDEYEPSSDEDMAKAYKDDWQAFGKWYMKQGDLFKTRYDALAEGVRDVYRQRAVDAVATLRQSGSFQLGTEVVQLDGKSDWAKEEKVLRYVLRQPLTDKELGSAKALAATKEKLYQERKDRAATYAQAAAEHKELLKGKQSAIAEEKALAEKEKKEAEELEKVLKQADDERLAGYGRKVERKVTFGSLVKDDQKKEGEVPPPEPAVVVVPRKMYAEAAGALGAAGGGFYAFIPGVADGIPVMAGDVENIQVNAPVLNLLDGKKDKLTGQQLRALANEGLMIPVQFSAFQKF